ncbi:MAG: type II toxin-antitoxin system HicA family toxin [Chthoniobacterales bacterium]|nr:type II toxin-antitoxin system HicA family toxin [Chthoniobacterales bacterium]
MSKSEKALEKILNGQSDRNITFKEAVFVLQREGFFLDGGKRSHQVFRHRDSRKIVLPCHANQLKPIYIRQIRELLK